jgi:hypothetical protein
MALNESHFESETAPVLHKSSLFTQNFSLTMQCSFLTTYAETCKI